MEHVPRGPQGLPRQAGRPVTPSAHQLVALLAEEDRLRVLAAVVLGAGSVDEIRAATGLDADRVARAVGRLRGGGLVDAAGGLLHARPDVLKEAARGAASGPNRADRVATDPVLRVFVRGGKLTSIPANRAKRLVVLDLLAQAFEPGHRYAEPEVNATIEGLHPDYATLRRYLVDEGFLNREGGMYWRSGGTFHVD